MSHKRLNNLLISIICGLLCVVLLLLSGCSTPKPWTTRNKVLAGVMMAGTAADMWSTSYALSNGATELNPLYGENPSDSTLALSGAISSGVFLVIGHFLEPEARDWFFGIVGGGRFLAAGWNTTQTYAWTH